MECSIRIGFMEVNYIKQRKNDEGAALSKGTPVECSDCVAPLVGP